MTRDELKQHLVGKTIRDVTFMPEPAADTNHWYNKGDLMVESIEFTDGTILHMEGNDDQYTPEVRVILYPPAMKL